MPNFEKYCRDPKTIVEVAEGENLFSQGDPGDAMFVVLDGELDIVVDGTVVDRITTGRLFGEMAMIEHSDRSATVRAVTPARVACINRKQFLFMVHEAPTFALDVMREMAERIHHLHAQLNG